MTNSMPKEERIRQSAVRVRSGIKLVGFMLLVAAAGFFSGIPWLLKVAIAASAFFTVVTLLEWWNVRRLQRSPDTAR